MREDPTMTNDLHEFAASILQAMEDCGIRTYYHDEERGQILFLKGIDGPICHVDYAILYRREELVLQVICPIRPDMSDREAVRSMCEYLMLVNSRSVPAGYLTMDSDDGEISYRNTILIDGEYPNTEVLRHLLQIAGITVRTFFPAIVDVAVKGADPKEAFRNSYGFLDEMLETAVSDRDLMTELTEEEYEMLSRIIQGSEEDPLQPEEDPLREGPIDE